MIDPRRELTVIDLPMDVLFGKPPRMHRDAKRIKPRIDLVPDLSGIGMDEALLRVLRLPTVGSKNFLITIGDRTVGGLNHRDPMVGPWQVPVADCAVTIADFDGYAGEAMAMAERAPVALLSSADAARLAVGEAITNLAAAPIDQLGEIRLSANWMAAINHPGEDAALFDAVKAIGMELCPELDIAIPVGKDSMSMQTEWHDGEMPQRTVAPVSLVITGFARVSDVRRTLTPQLRMDRGDSELWLIDLGAGRDRLGGSALTQVFNRGGGVPPDLDSPKRLKALFDLVQEANASGLLLAYHDRSDGGVITTLLEMAFAGHCGLEIRLDGWAEATLRALFNEELGAVMQVAEANREAFEALLVKYGLAACSHCVGRPKEKLGIKLFLGDEVVFKWQWSNLFRAWNETSHAMQRLRDNPLTADAELAWRLDDTDPGISPELSFDPGKTLRHPSLARPSRAAVHGWRFSASRVSTARWKWRQRLIVPASRPWMCTCPIWPAAGSSWRTSAVWRPAAVSPTAMCLGPGVAGPHRSSTTTCCASSSRPSLPTRAPSRWASATAARCWPSSRTSFPGPGTGRNSCAMPRSSTRPAWSRWRCSNRTASSSRAWPVRASRRGGAWRGRVEFPAGLQSGQSHPAARFVDNRGRPTENFPLNINGSPRRAGRVHCGGWPRDHHDAASRAGVPQCADELAPWPLGRGFAVDENVPQCPRVVQLTR